MKIQSIDTIILESPYEYGVKAAEQESTGPKYSCLVRIRTDEGIEGVGDVDSHPHVIKAMIDAPTATPGLIDGLRNVLIGMNPLETDLIWNKLYEAGYYYGRRGGHLQAISGIDIALWDIKGKVLNQSVSVLLGGRFHEKMKAYASTLFRDTPDNMKAAVNKYRTLGFKAIKFGWGSFTQNPRYGISLVEAARKEAGDEIDIMVDGYITNNDIVFAIEIVNRLAEFGVYWMEEPLPSDNLIGFRKLSENAKVRIATGEQLGGTFEYAELIEKGNPDIVQFDISRCGGLTEAKKIVEMARMHSKLICPHAWTSDILTAASLHLNSNTPDAIFQEFCTNDTPTSRDIALNPIELTPDGYINVPTLPGLGISLNEEIIERYKVV